MPCCAEIIRLARFSSDVLMSCANGSTDVAGAALPKYIVVRDRLGALPSLQPGLVYTALQLERVVDADALLLTGLEQRAQQRGSARIVAEPTGVAHVYTLVVADDDAAPLSIGSLGQPLTIATLTRALTPALRRELTRAYPGAAQTPLTSADDIVRALSRVASLFDDERARLFRAALDALLPVGVVVLAAERTVERAKLLALPVGQLCTLLARARTLTAPAERAHLVRYADCARDDDGLMPRASLARRSDDDGTLAALRSSRSTRFTAETPPPTDVFVSLGNDEYAPARDYALECELARLVRPGRGRALPRTPAPVCRERI